MNTDQERAILAVAQEGAMNGGDMDAPTGWFGVAHVTPDYADWLAEEHDLELPPEGWYMVTENSDGVIFVMPATEELCFRWFDSVQFAYECYSPDEVTEEARLVLLNVELLHQVALSAFDPGHLQWLVQDQLLEDYGIEPSDVNWPVLHHLLTPES